MTQRLKGKTAAETGSPARAGASAGQSDDPAEPEVRRLGRWTVVAVCLLLALAVWVVFGQTRHHEFVNYDDQEYVYENSAVTQGLNRSGIAWAFTHPHGGNWHPLTSLSHMLDCQIYGLKPGGHHLTNVLLHTTTAILLFLVLRNLTGAFWPSAFVAAVFAVHPLRVESVAWVAERKDVLSGLFFVLTLGAYARYAQRRSKVEGPGSSAGTSIQALDSRLSTLDYALALLSFALGLMSKPMLVTLPFVLLLLDYWPLHRLELATVKRRLLEKIPFLLLSAADCGATLLAQKEAMHTLHNLSLLPRIGNALVTYAVYIRQMFYPADLAVFYPHTGKQLSVWTIGWCVGVLSLITVGVVRWQRQRPYLLVGWLWYLGMLAPVIGILQVGNQARADRYTYLPQIGLYIMVAWGAVELGGAGRWRRGVLATVAGLVLTGLLVVARVQTTYWRDSVSLWLHTLACTSGNYMAHYNLGCALAAKGKRPEAILHYQQALQCKPNHAEAHNNLGVLLGEQGQWPQAGLHYQQALQVKPNYPEAHYNLGIALAAQGQWPEAIAQFERALQLNPEDAEAHYNLGIALGQQGQWPAAIPHFERAVQLKPDNAQAHYNLGLALAKQRQWPAAIPHFERALQLKPEDASAHNYLGLALVKQGQWPAAIAHFERALQVNPDHVEAGGNLAWLLATCREAQFRNPAEALRRAQRAGELTQSSAPEVLDTLAAAQAAGGDFARAVATAKEALALATAAGKQKLAREIQSRLDLYQAGQPYCEPPLDGGRENP